MGVCAPCAAVRPPGTPHSLPGHRKEGHLEKLPCTSFILTEVFLLYACIHLRVSSGKKEQDNLSRVMSPSRAKAAGQTQQLWGGGGGVGGGEVQFVVQVLLKPHVDPSLIFFSTAG